MIGKLKYRQQGHEDVRKKVKEGSEGTDIPITMNLAENSEEEGRKKFCQALLLGCAKPAEAGINFAFGHAWLEYSKACGARVVAVEVRLPKNFVQIFVDYLWLQNYRKPLKFRCRAQLQQLLAVYIYSSAHTYMNRVHILRTTIGSLKGIACDISGTFVCTKQAKVSNS